MSRRQEPPGDSGAGRQPLPPPAPGRSASRSVTCSQCGRLNFTTGSLCNDCQRGPAARLERRHSSEADRHYHNHSHRPSSSPSSPISGGRKRGSNGEVRRASSVDNRSPLNGTARSPRPSGTARPIPSPSHDRRSGDRQNGSGMKWTPWRTGDTRQGSTTAGGSTSSHSSPRNGQRDAGSASNTVVLTESPTEKQPSRVSKEPEVIDLISSDEESLTNSQASKAPARTAQGSGSRSRKLSQAAQGDAGGSQDGNPSSKSVPSSSILSHPPPPPPSSSQPLPPPTSAHTASSSSDSSGGETAPKMSRRFPDVNFVVTDFPTDAEANAARKRGGSEPATATQPKQGTSPAVPPAGETPASEPPVAADSTHDMTQEPSPTPTAEVSAPPDVPQVRPPPAQPEPVVAAAPAPPAPVAARGRGGETIPATYTPIVIDESQENIVVEETDSSLFMSRAFPTVEFNAADFPVHGIGIARRTVLPRHPSSAASEVATEASSTTNEPPSGTPSRGTPPNKPANGGVSRVPPPSVSVAATPAAVDDAATPASQRTNEAAIDAPSGTAGAPVCPAPTPAVDQAPPATVTPLVKIEKKSSLTPILRIVSKPKTLGECSPEFLVIMKESGGESYMDGDEVWRQQQLQLLDVVDLTAISDSEDDESDGDVVLVTISQTRKNPAVDLITAPIAAQMSSTTGSTTASVKAEGATDTKSSAPQTVEKAECMICEKHQSVRLMVLCGICGLYYHRRCAREHGGSVRCWNCEPDDMIDDTELTDTARDQAIGILSVFRQLSPDSEDEEMEDAGVEEDGAAEGGETAAAANSSTGGEDGDDEGEDMDISADESEENPLLAAGETKTDRRWRSFLTESTAALDAHFHEVTRSITAELQTEEGRARYSRGFTSPAEFNAGMNDIVNHYVQREREQQRAVQQASAAAIAAQAAAAAEAAATAGATASAPATAPAIATATATTTAPADAERNTTGPEGVSLSPAIGSAGDASTLQTTNVDAAGRSATAIPATGGA